MESLATETGKTTSACPKPSRATVRIRLRPFSPTRNAPTVQRLTCLGAWVLILSSEVGDNKNAFRLNCISFAPRSPSQRARRGDQANRKQDIIQRSLHGIAGITTLRYHFVERSVCLGEGMRFRW
ncbi:hypothetical protein ARMSODRAFT_117825 [Armillaria solidipes]|uniref:Uncharacterized protein n=1 Tax=Armillaria solidipes TaxID=1076256 RepID=A0A2H3AHX9_9AGAR|nr:hypothetical protein ARMSODRAFT_117825 [Armillaria solidipes]